MEPLSSDNEAWGFIRAVFEREVPEVASGVVEIRAVARLPGFRTKVALTSLDPAINPVYACVGERDHRIKEISARLGEPVDLLPWTDSVDRLVDLALAPAFVDHVVLNRAQQRATVTVPIDQLGVALGPHGENRDLASRLTGWDIEIVPSPDAA